MSSLESALPWFGTPLRVVMENIFVVLHYPGFPETVSLLILMGMIFVIARYKMSTRHIRKGLFICCSILQKCQNTAHRLTDLQEFEATVAQQTETTIPHCWQRFRETLVERKAVDVCTVSPSVFFNLDRLRLEAPLRRLAKWSGLFVGIGLLVTFLGLVAALNAASDVIKAATAIPVIHEIQKKQDTPAPGDAHDTTINPEFKPNTAVPISGSQESIQLALKDLLSAATFKFYTSIFGLLASLIVSFCEKRFRRDLEKNCYSICQSLEKTFPPVTTEQLLADQVEEAQQTTTQLKQFNAEMREGLIQMSGAMTKSLQEAVTPVQQELSTGFEASASAMNVALQNSMTPVQKGIEVLSENIGAMEQTISRTIGENLKSMQEKTLNTLADKLGVVVNQQAGTELNSLAKTLDALTASLAGMQNSLQEGGGNFAQTLALASSELREGIAVLASAAEQIGQNMHTDMAMAQQTLKEQLDGLAVELTERSRATAKQLTNETSSVLGSMQNSFTAVNTNMDKLTGALSGSSKALIGHQKSVIDASERTTKAAQILQQASGNLSNAVVPMTTAMHSMESSLENLQSCSSDVGENIKQAKNAIHESAQTLEQNWQIFLDRFNGMDEELANSLQLVAQNLDSNTTKVSKYVGEIDNHLGNALAQLAQGIEDLDEVFSEYLPRLRDANKKS